MNGRERVLSVLRGVMPDRIPHFEWSFSHSVMQQVGIWPKLSWSYEDFIELLDIDAVVAWPLYETRRFKERLVIDEMGIVRAEGREEYALSVDEYAPLKTFRDLSKFNFPNPDRDLCWLKLQSLVKRFKGEKAIIMKLRDVFSWPRELRGYENLLIDLAQNQDTVIELVAKSADYCKQQAEIAIQMGAEIIVTADDIATNSGLIFSPKTFREIFLPKYREIVGYIKRLGAFVVKHSDGNLMDIIDDLIEAGIDCLDPVDPMAGMDLRRIKETYGKRVALKGNVSCAGVLEGEDCSQVVEETKRCIAEGGPNGRYILSSSNSIHSGVAYSNYHAMLETLREYGTYPLL